MTSLVSRQAQLLLGKTDLNCVGQVVFSLFEGFTFSPDAEALRSTDQRTVTVDLEQENVSPGVYLSGRWTRITGPSGDLANLAFVFRDVTREKRKEKLQRDFLSLVSHKLKTPLTIVSGYLSLIAAGKYGPMDEQLSEAFHLVAPTVRGQLHAARRVGEPLRGQAQGGGKLKKSASSVFRSVRHVFTSGAASGWKCPGDAFGEYPVAGRMSSGRKKFHGQDLHELCP